MNQACIKLFIVVFILALPIVTLSVGPPPVYAAAAPTPEQGDSITGTVLETMNAAGYTYVNVDSANGPVWVAIPESPVNKGDEISFEPGMEMKDFHSKSLNRTFPSVIFSNGIAGDMVLNPHRSTPAPATAPADDSFEAALRAETMTSGQQIKPELTSGGSGGAIAPFTEISVEKADGENSFTVAELFTQAPELNGKTVRVRGKVVKYNANIMGRNWVHIQDGTGDPIHNTHDLVVTISEEIGSPEILTFEGTLAADKDFGAGYKYVVIVENGTIIK